MSVICRRREDPKKTFYIRRSRRGSNPHLHPTALKGNIAEIKYGTGLRLLNSHTPRTPSTSSLVVLGPNMMLSLARPLYHNPHVLSAGAWRTAIPPPLRRVFLAPPGGRDDRLQWGTGRSTQLLPTRLLRAYPFFSCWKEVKGREYIL